jgi:hypothetical protein
LNRYIESKTNPPAVEVPLDDIPERLAEEWIDFEPPPGKFEYCDEDNMLATVDLRISRLTCSPPWLLWIIDLGRLRYEVPTINPEHFAPLLIGLCEDEPLLKRIGRTALYRNIESKRRSLTNEARQLRDLVCDMPPAQRMKCCRMERSSYKTPRDKRPLDNMFHGIVNSNVAPERLCTAEHPGNLFIPCSGFDIEPFDGVGQWLTTTITPMLCVDPTGSYDEALERWRVREWFEVVKSDYEQLGGWLRGQWLKQHHGTSALDPVYRFIFEDQSKRVHEEAKYFLCRIPHEEWETFHEPDDMKPAGTVANSTEPQPAIVTDRDASSQNGSPTNGESLIREVPAQEPFVFRPKQEAIWEALKDCALRTDYLAELVGDRRSLFDRKNKKGRVTKGLVSEMVQRGMVRNHSRRGYYRLDAPPPDLKPTVNAPK